MALHTAESRRRAHPRRRGATIPVAAILGVVMTALATMTVSATTASAAANLEFDPESIAGQYTISPQAAAIGADGDIYHDTLGASGVWQSWEPMAGFNGASHFSATSVSIATMPDGSSQMVAVGQDADVYHNIRNADGNWQGWAPMPGFNGASHFTAGSVAIAGMPDGTSQVLATGADGNIYHDIRNADGHWRGWEPVSGLNGASHFDAMAISITGMPDGSSQIVATDQAGTVYHNIRYVTGLWQGWAALAGFNNAAVFTSTYVLSITGMPDGSSQIVAIGLDGTIYHDIRYTTGHWQGWEPLAGANGASHFSAVAVSITALANDSSLVLAAQTDDNYLFDDARSSGGTWFGWNLPPGFNGAPAFQVGI